MKLETAARTLTYAEGWNPPPHSVSAVWLCFLNSLLKLSSNNGNNTVIPDLNGMQSRCEIWTRRGWMCIPEGPPSIQNAWRVCKVNSLNAVVFLLISIAFQTTSCLTANQLWQAGFLLADLSSSVWAARPHPCWVFFFFFFQSWLTRRQLQHGGERWSVKKIGGDLSHGTKKCWRGCVFVGV